MNFEVTAPNLFFFQNLISFTYNTSAFGSNIIGSNKVTFVKGSNFNTNAYDIAGNDASSSKIQISVSPSAIIPKNNYAPPTNTRINLCRVKIKYDWSSSCFTNTNLANTDLSSNANITFWTSETAATSGLQKYNNFSMSCIRLFSCPLALLSLQVLQVQTTHW